MSSNQYYDYNYFPPPPLLHDSSLHPPRLSPSPSISPSYSLSSSRPPSRHCPQPSGDFPSTETLYQPLAPNDTDNAGVKTWISSHKRPDRHSDELHRDGWFYLTCSLLGSLTPVGFLVLIAVTARLDGKEESEWGRNVMRVILLVPSVYPVIFAALLSRDLRTFALDLAQRGTTLGMLHQLLSSCTVGGVIFTIFNMHTLNLTLTILLAIWTLSPLGGQAALRMVSVNDVVSFHATADVWYRSSDDTSFFFGSNPYEESFSMLSEVYGANFLVPEKVRKLPVDVFGNIRIPMLESLNSSTADGDGWIKTPLSLPAGIQPVPFASLIGIPVQGVPAAGNVTFTMESNYVYLSCDAPQNITTVPPSLWPLFNTSTIKDPYVESEITGANGILPSLAVNMTDDDWNSGRWKNRSQSLGPRKVGFAQLDKNPSKWERVGNKSVLIEEYYWTSTNCTVTTTYVESSIFCNTGECAVTAIRPSKLADREPEDLTHLDGASARNKLFYRFLSQATDTSASKAKHRTTVTQRYIADPSNSKLLSDTGTPPLLNVTAVDFSTRFTTTYNSFYTAFSALTHVLGTTKNLSETIPAADTPGEVVMEMFPKLTGKTYSYRPGLPARGNSTFFAQKTTAEVVDSERRYVVNRVWLGIFTVSVCLLLLLTLAGFLLQFRRIAPDFLGTVGGMVRDSPYIILKDRGDGFGPAGSVLDGVEAARRWKDVSVGIRDVKSGEEVGRVGLVGLEEAEREGWGKVKLGRRYE